MERVIDVSPCHIFPSKGNLLRNDFLSIWLIWIFVSSNMSVVINSIFISLLYSHVSNL